MWTENNIAVVAVAMFLGGLLKGVIGLGLPTISLPIMASFLGLKTAIALVLIPSLATNAWQGLTGGAFRVLILRLRGLIVASVIGVWLGAGILAKADAEILTGILGILLCLYVIYLVTAPHVPQPGKLEPLLSPVIGALSGFAFGLTGSYMLPGVVYIQALNLGREGLIQALGMTFTVVSSSLLAALWVNGQLSMDLGLMSASGLVPVFAGMAIGRRLRGRLDETRFRQVFCAGLFLLGLHLVAKAFLW